MEDFLKHEVQILLVNVLVFIMQQVYALYMLVHSLSFWYIIDLYAYKFIIKLTSYRTTNFGELKNKVSWIKSNCIWHVFWNLTLMRDDRAVRYLQKYTQPYFKAKRHKDRNPKESPKLQMLQARFDWVCSWTVMESASYLSRPLAPV